MNVEQVTAVNACRKTPLVVLAGPGSGKTTTLVRRCMSIRDEVEKEVLERNATFLIVTFSKNASLEMVDRIRRFGEPSQSLLSSTEVATFHSFSYKLIMEHCAVLGFESAPRVCSHREACGHMKEALNAIVPRTANNSTRKNDFDSSSRKAVRILLQTFDTAKALGVHSLFPRLLASLLNAQELTQVFEHFQRRLSSLSLIRCSDMVPLAVKLLKENDHILRTVHQRHRYCLCDEFQDTNKVQLELLTLLGAHGRITVVGDRDQLIYSFQGADKNNFAAFESFFGSRSLSVNVVTLRVNYRSSTTIVGVCNTFINHGRSSKNPLPLPLQQLSNNSKGNSRISFIDTSNNLQSTINAPKIMVTPHLVKGPAVKVAECVNESVEFSFVASIIRDLMSTSGIPANEIAVLFRTNALGTELLSYLKTCHKDLQVHLNKTIAEEEDDDDDGAGDTAATTTLRSICSLLRLANNENDDEACDELLRNAISESHRSSSSSSSSNHKKDKQQQQQPQQPLAAIRQFASRNSVHLFSAVKSMCGCTSSCFSAAAETTKKANSRNQSAAAAAAKPYNRIFGKLIQSVGSLSSFISAYNESSPTSPMSMNKIFNRAIDCSGIRQETERRRRSAAYFKQHQQTRGPPASRYSVKGILQLTGSRDGGAVTGNDHRNSSWSTATAQQARDYNTGGTTSDDDDEKDPMAHLETTLSGLINFVQSESRPLTASKMTVRRSLEVIVSRVLGLVNEGNNGLILSTSSSSSSGQLGKAKNDSSSSSSSPDGNGKVWLGTIHRAKGKEWRAVIVIRVNEDMFGGGIGEEAPDDHDTSFDYTVIPGVSDPAATAFSCSTLEEEQRLLYVSMSRAKEVLIMSYLGKDREHMSTEPSQHLLPLFALRNPDLVVREVKHAGEDAATAAGTGVTSSYPPSTSSFTVGSLAVHTASGIDGGAFYKSYNGISTKDNVAASTLTAVLHTRAAAATCQQQGSIVAAGVQVALKQQIHKNELQIMNRESEEPFARSSISISEHYSSYSCVPVTAREEEYSTVATATAAEMMRRPSSVAPAGEAAAPAPLVTVDSASSNDRGLMVISGPHPPSSSLGMETTLIVEEEEDKADVLLPGDHHPSNTVSASIVELFNKNNNRPPLAATSRNALGEEQMGITVASQPVDNSLRLPLVTLRGGNNNLKSGGYDDDHEEEEAGGICSQYHTTTVRPEEVEDRHAVASSSPSPSECRVGGGTTAKEISLDHFTADNDHCGRQNTVNQFLSFRYNISRKRPFSSE